MTYQAVFRDGGNNLIVNGTIGVEFAIRQGSGNGPIVYVEEHTESTNSNGLLTLIIGDGNVVSGSFSAINWANGPYFLQTSSDPTGGTNYTITTLTQFLSVPYALYAETANTTINDQVDDADNDPTNEIETWSTLAGIPIDIADGDDVDDADADPTNEIQILSFSNDTLYLTNGGSIYLGAYAVDNVNDADPDPSNEIQVLSFSNDTLYLSNGGSIYLGAYAVDNVNDADSDPTNEIELPASANIGDLLEYDGSNWVAAAPSGGSGGAGTVMYIYDGQTCPAGWNTQQINVGIFGGAAVDGCWTDSPCSVMYIYDGQSCPSGWTHHSIGVAVINGSTTPVDACFKCY